MTDARIFHTIGYGLFCYLLALSYAQTVSFGGKFLFFLEFIDVPKKIGHGNCGNLKRGYLFQTEECTVSAPFGGYNIITKHPQGEIMAYKK